MARLRQVVLALSLVTAALTLAGCSFDSSLGDVTCNEEGLRQGDRVCEDGYWVAADGTQDADDATPDAEPDATDVLPDTTDAADDTDTGNDADSGDCEPTTDDETTCDQLDNDCDGEIDEELTTDYYFDNDGDGYGDPNQRVDRCDPPAGDYVENSGDCNDDNADINPGIVEECGPDGGDCPFCNGIDDNCDGQADELCPCDPEGTPSQSCYTFSSGTPGEGPCEQGTQQCVNGTFGECTGQVGPSDETCNGADDDCDGEADEGVLNTYYRDDDGDGYGRDNDTETGCSPPNDYVAQSGDCDDGKDSVYPGASETCNDTDDDCDGDTDEGVKSTFYLDSDGDGFGDPNTTQQACSASGDYVDNDQDCDDSDDKINPGESESCNGIDDNCDGTVDEGVLTTYYLDSDGDSYGDPNTTQDACDAPTDYVDNDQDCDDSDANINPDAKDEDCDGVDDDCDGDIDEDGGVHFYEDADGDTFGNDGSKVKACSAPTGYVSDNTDCDDQDPTTYPGAPEICDDRDNNCVDGKDETPESDNWCANQSGGTSQTVCDNNDAPDGGPCCETAGDSDDICEFESRCFNTDGGSPVDDDGDGDANCADSDCDGLYCAPGKVCNVSTGNCEAI